jgi:thioredoxin-dependent peroxiredoxin
MARKPEIGEPAPDFMLPGIVLRDGQADRGDYTLSGLRGSPIVLAFYPGDNTAVCTRQLAALTAS